MTNTIQRATHISQIYRALFQGPLMVEQLPDFYKETYKARGDKPRSQMARLLTNNIGINQHLLFVGYRGCGKSTELRRLEQDIQNDFIVFNYSVYSELDPNSLNYIELIIVTMERLFSFVKEKELRINKSYIKNISDFLKTKEIEEIKGKYMDLSAEAGSETAFTIPYIQKFFLKLKGSLKNSRSIKTVLTETVEPHFSTLLNHCNDLIAEIRLQLNDLGKKDLVIIIEDLDKIKLSEARRLFFDYANQITSFNANIIYTFPISLYYDIKFNPIRTYFSKIYELPMIKVHERNGEPSPEGINTLKKIIEARMDLTLFSDEKILDDCIMYSGGCIRDLFAMITEAAESAQDEDRETINESDKEYALKKLKKEYKNTIADHVNANGEVDVQASEFYNLLNQINNDPNKLLDNTKPALHLRQNLTILGYNGDGWCDVHPIVKMILEERNS